MRRYILASISIFFTLTYSNELRIPFHSQRSNSLDDCSKTQWITLSFSISGRTGQSTSNRILEIMINFLPSPMIKFKIEFKRDSERALALE
jgi:hypothetical protein